IRDPINRMVALLPLDGGGDGDPTDPVAGANPHDARGCLAVHLDDRSAGADDLFLDAALQSARSRIRTIRRTGELRVLPDRPGLPCFASKYARPGRLRARHYDPDRNSAGAAAGPAGDRAQLCAADGDRAVLRDADGQRPGLEEPVDASGLGPVRLDRDAVWRHADRLVQRYAAACDHPDRIVAMVAVRDPDSAHRAAVARRRTEGSGRDGWRPRAVDFHLHHAAASGAADYGGDPDRDDFSAHRVRRDLRHHRWRAGPADDEYCLPDLFPGPDPV